MGWGKAKGYKGGWEQDKGKGWGGKPGGKSWDDWDEGAWVWQPMFWGAEEVYGLGGASSSAGPEAAMPAPVSPSIPTASALQDVWHQVRCEFHRA